MKINFVIFSLLLSIFLWNCSDQFSTNSENTTLQIVQLDSTIALGKNYKHKVEVKVSPYSINDIDKFNLTFEIFQEDQSILFLELKDDGLEEISGDLYRYDGIFSALWNDSVFTNEGNYTYRISLFEDLKEITSLEGDLKVRKVSDFTIYLIQAPDTIPETSTTFAFQIDSIKETENFFTIRALFYPNDTNATSPIKIIQFNNITVQKNIELTVDSTFGTSLKGFYRLLFEFKDSFQQTATIEIPSAVYVENSPPIIQNIQMPDSIKIPQTSSFFDISVTVMDHRGHEDILTSYFKVKKPDGNYSNNGNPFYLSDNGLTPDIHAGDGIYSSRFSVDHNTPAGEYLFEFYAEDRVNQTGEMKTKRIVLY